MVRDTVRHQSPPPVLRAPDRIILGKATRFQFSKHGIVNIFRTASYISVSFQSGKLPSLARLVFVTNTTAELTGSGQFSLDKEDATMVLGTARHGKGDVLMLAKDEWVTHQLTPWQMAV